MILTHEIARFRTHAGSNIIVSTETGREYFGQIGHGTPVAIGPCDANEIADWLVQHVRRAVLTACNVAESTGVFA